MVTTLQTPRQRLVKRAAPQLQHSVNLNENHGSEAVVVCGLDVVNASPIIYPDVTSVDKRTSFPPTVPIRIPTTGVSDTYILAFFVIDYIPSFLLRGLP